MEDDDKSRGADGDPADYYNAGHGIIEIDATRDIKVGTAEWDAYLARSNAPDHWKSYFPGLEWLVDQLDRAKKAEPNKMFMPWRDRGWFLERMLANRQLLEASIRNNDAVHSALYAAELAILQTESRIKFKWEPAALTGKVQRDILEEQREKLNRERREERSHEWDKWNDEAAKIWARHPTWKKSPVAIAVKRNLNLPDAERTIRARLKKTGEAG